MPTDDGAIRATLRLNATFSGASGLALAVGAPRFADVLGTGHPGWVRLVGVGLIGFSAGLAALAGSAIDQVSRLTPAVIVADLAWVVASVATVGMGWYADSGPWLVGVVALAVGALAAAQLVGLKRAGSAI